MKKHVLIIGLLFIIAMALAACAGPQQQNPASGHRRPDRSGVGDEGEWSL